MDKTNEQYYFDALELFKKKIIFLPLQFLNICCLFLKKIQRKKCLKNIYQKSFINYMKRI